MADRELEAASVASGLRVGVAGLICLVGSAILQSSFSATSVFSAHLVLAQYPFSAFQKGVERILGRVLGIAYGLLLIAFFHSAPLIFVPLLVLGLLAFGYVYSANRLGYAAFNGNLLLGIMAILGITQPTSALSTAVDMMEQVVLGVGAAMLVDWVSGAERTLAIQAGGEPMWPLRRDWLLRSARISSSTLASLLAALHLGVPLVQATLSGGVLATAEDHPALIKKGWQRAAAACLSAGYVLVAMVFLNLVPSFALLMAFLFLGMFLAAFFTKAWPNNSYLFLQTGLVIPLLLLGARLDEVGSLLPALQRFAGVLTGLVAAEVVGLLWRMPAAPVVPPGPAASR
jgi:hypothetical protein